MKLKDKVAIVTGGGRGIGRAIAEAFARDGAEVIVTAARQKREIEDVASKIGGTAVLVDVSNKDAVQKLADSVVSDFGGIDILVNNAARGMKFVNESFMTEPMPFWEADPDMWRMVVDTNVNGVFLMTRAVIPHMLKRGFGRIINISINQETMKRKGFTPYGPSKAALESMSAIWAQELQGTGITLNVLLPGGATNTGMIPDTFPEPKRKELIDPAVMGPPAVYLASDDASRINGQRIVAIEWKNEHKAIDDKLSCQPVGRSLFHWRSPSMTTISTDVLFTPFRIHNLTLANRIVMAPMTRSQSPGGIPGPNVAAYYRRRAENGVGLILTEGTVIAHPASAGSPNVPRFFGEQSLAGWARVSQAVQDAGGRIVPQLWHVGMARAPGSEPNPEAPPVGPSGLVKPGEQTGEPLAEAEIITIIDAYAQGAADAMRLGFDGIELHGAHGYLIDQFFWEGTNRRTDRWGGDLVGRTRFGVEVVKACRRRTAPDFPILLRFSQWKMNDYDARLATSPEELARFLAPLVDAGVDVFHCSTRRFWRPEFAGSDLNLAGWTKKLTGRPVVTVGSVGLDAEFTSSLREGRSAANVGLDRLLEMVARGEVDLVAVGRALLVDPAWAAKVRDGRVAELLPFTPEALKTLA